MEGSSKHEKNFWAVSHCHARPSPSINICKRGAKTRTTDFDFAVLQRGKSDHLTHDLQPDDQAERRRSALSGEIATERGRDGLLLTSLGQLS